MGLLDKVKQSMVEAAEMAKEGIEEISIKREIGHAYGDLGKTAFDLATKGELAHAGLDPGVEKIKKLKADLAKVQAERAAQAKAKAKNAKS